MTQMRTYACMTRTLCSALQTQRKLRDEVWIPFEMLRCLLLSVSQLADNFDFFQEAKEKENFK